MKTPALLLIEGEPTRDDRSVARVLNFFGIAPRLVPASSFDGTETTAGDSLMKYRLICSANVLVSLLDRLGTEFWNHRLHSVFTYADGSSNSLQKLLNHLTGNKDSDIRRSQPASRWKVSDKLPEFCGPLSGIDVVLPPSAAQPGFILDAAQVKLHDIISNEHGAAFVRIDQKSVPVFVSFASAIIDMDAPLTAANFDVRDHFFAAVPIAAYVRWAFAENCWKTPEINACLVIDDPVLKPRYGFLDFQELLSNMERHNFSTSIAFIPWNWRRSNSRVVQLFKENSHRYSLSIHGCDHTGGEFGTENTNTLAWKAGQAIERMKHHETATGIHHDRVMVFPQGVFSETAMSVLKRSDFTASVNTEVVSSGQSNQRVRISDVWDVAVMSYGGFPIFTRRYPHQGIENFAFDVLLGKPCLVVIHQQDCEHNMKDVTQFIARLNGLQCRLSWRSLGEVVKRTSKQREVTTGVVETEMYALELELQNHFQERKRFSVRKLENDPGSIQNVFAGDTPVVWTFADGYIHFDIDLNPEEAIQINVRCSKLEEARNTESVKYKLKTMARRYLSEVRDNYPSLLRRAAGAGS